METQKYHLETLMQFLKWAVGNSYLGNEDKEIAEMFRIRVVGWKIGSHSISTNRPNIHYFSKNRCGQRKHINYPKYSQRDMSVCGNGTLKKVWVMMEVQAVHVHKIVGEETVVTGICEESHKASHQWECPRLRVIKTNPWHVCWNAMISSRSFRISSLRVKILV